MGGNNVMMYLSYAIVAVIDFLALVSLVYSIVRRKAVDVVFSLGFLGFLVFMTSDIILGGSAFNNAATNYELYQEGHYYLMSHGNYTEVSYDVFKYMKVIEVVGFVSFGFAFVFALIKNKMETGKFFARR